MPAQTTPLPVHRLERLTEHVYLLELGPTIPGRTWLPGQWISLHLPVGPHPPLVRAYTLAAPPDGSGLLPIIFDHVPDGLGSTHLVSLGPGDTVNADAIVGKFVLPDPLPAVLLFGARFTGVAPFRAMLQVLNTHPDPPQVHLVYGMPSVQDAVFHEEFLHLAETAPWFSYHPTMLDPTSGAWHGATGEERPLLQELYAAYPQAVPMLAGVRAFTQPARAFFMDQGLERRAIRVESYD